MLGYGEIDGVWDVGFIGDVAGDEGGARAEVASRLMALIFLYVGEDYFGTVGYELGCCFFAYAACGAGDQSYFPF